MANAHTSNFLVIFDMDNTLVVNQPAAKRAYKNAINYIAKQHGLYNQRFKLYNHWKKLVQQLKSSSDPAERQFEYSLRLLLQEQKIPDTYVPQAMAVYEKDLLAQIQPQAGAKDLLIWLKQGNSQLAVATGTPKSLAKKKLKAVDLFSHIDLLITSNQTQSMKPDPEYYQQAIKQSGLAKSKTIVIGDSEKDDIAPAKKIGLATITIPSRKFNLNELKDQLAEFFNKA